MSRTTLHIALGYVSAICCIATVPCRAQETLDVAIEPAKVRVHPFDPIFLRVVLKSNSTTPLVASRAPTAARRTLKLELRKLGQQEYRDIYTVTEDSGGLVVSLRVEMFPPKGHRTTGVLVMETTDNRVFGGSGMYEMRASLRDSKEFSGVSEPIQVEVLEATKEQLAMGRELSDLAMHGVQHGIADNLSENVLLAAAKSLEDCELKRTGLLLATIAAIRDANSRDSFEEACNRLAELRKGCPEPMQDWISLTAANTFRSINKFQLALEEVRRLPQNSFERQPLEQSLLEKLRSVPNNDE